MAGMRALCRIRQRFSRAFKCVRGFYIDSPSVFTLVVLVLFCLLAVAIGFSVLLARLVSVRSTVLIDLVLFWLFGRLVARTLMFPGSLKLYQYNTEATFRVEIARQYVHYLRQLWAFLQCVSAGNVQRLHGSSFDMVARGCTVVETLAACFRQQKQDEVRFSEEQEQAFVLAQDLEKWLMQLQISAADGDGQAEDAPAPLLTWLRRKALDTAPYGAHCLFGLKLAGSSPDASQQRIAQLERLMAMLDGLQRQKDSWARSVLRFFRTPTVGSLNQLRAELQLRHGAQHIWVQTRRGRRVDCMLVPCFAGPSESDTAGEPGDKAAGQPSARVSNPFGEPVLVYCNPNAAYYETMVYQNVALNFWLKRGVSVLLFNYGGYGRSSGTPSPPRVTEDGDAIVKYLVGKGVTRIGVYGRSIGGVVACHLARRHPDLVKLLVVDRSMSTLENAAAFLYGRWAAMGLRLTAMMADNVDNYVHARCYKVMICDPKDGMILDMASLRSQVALRVLERVGPNERLVLDDDVLAKLTDAWEFFSVLFAICEGDDDSGSEVGGSRGLAPMGGSESSRSVSSARQPSFKGPADTGEHSLPLRGNSEPVGSQWLEDNPAMVRTTMAGLVDQVRSVVDGVGGNLDGGGVSLNDVFADKRANVPAALRSMLANLQVWGALGEHLDEEYAETFRADAMDSANLCASGVTDRELYFFLRQADLAFIARKGISIQRMVELEEGVTPEIISTYYRRAVRIMVFQVRDELRRRIATLQHSFAHASDTQAGEHGEVLLHSVLQHLGAVDNFVASLGRFFKTVDLALPSSPNGDPPRDGAGSPQPTFDYSVHGHVIHVDCGHNGALDDVHMRHLAVHLREAKFGRVCSEVV